MPRNLRVTDHANGRGTIEGGPFTKSSRGSQIQFYIQENRKAAYQELLAEEGCSMSEDLKHYIEERIIDGPKKVTPPAMIHVPERTPVNPDGRSVYFDKLSEQVIGPCRFQHTSTRVNALLGRYSQLLDTVDMESLMGAFSEQELVFLSNIAHWNELELSRDLRHDFLIAIADYAGRKDSGVDAEALMEKISSIEGPLELFAFEENLRTRYLKKESRKAG